MDLEESKEVLGKRNDTDVLEAILGHVGEMGLYQKLLFIGMLPFGFFFAFVYFGQMFIVATPQRHWCRVPELDHLDMELRRNLSAPGAALGAEWDRCHTYKADWSQVLLTLTPPDPSTPTIRCEHGWDFELTDIPYHTVVSERGWVCQYSGYAPMAQAVFFVGSFIGGFLIGWMADRFGRVPALVASNVIGAIGGIATIFTSGVWDFVFCRLLVGMSYDNCFMMMYILVLEYVGPRHRTYVANMSIALFFGSGCLVLPWLALWMGNWKTFLWVTSLPMLIALVVPFLVPESARQVKTRNLKTSEKPKIDSNDEEVYLTPTELTETVDNAQRWLLTRGRVNQAVEVLKKFEKVNGTKIPEDVLDEFIVTSRQTKQSHDTMLTLLKSGPLRFSMLIMVFVYMCCAVIFDGLVRMSENLGLDFFITFTLTSATEIPSVTLVALLLDIWGRRVLTCGPLATSGTLILIAMFVPKGIPQTTLAIFARFFINMSYNVMIQWATELLPTGVRALGSSSLHMSGYVATMLSPFIVYSERMWAALPLLILGVLAMLSGGAAVLLPETKDRPMPQTMAEGENIVREHSLCGKPQEDNIEVQTW